jgi:hypothetical protein
MRLGVLALLLASGCSLAQSLQMKSSTPRERETVYAVIGTFVVMSVVAAAIAGAPPEEPSMPQPSPDPTLGRQR